MPLLRTHAVLALLALALAAGAVACGGRGGDGQTEREADAEMIVERRVGEDVTCEDNGAVNVERHPDHLVTYICRNEDDEIYAATIAPDREVRSLSGPHRLKPASD